MSERSNVRLNSWKEIAGYLGREVRTVSRWEKEFGLPVHRVGGGKGRSVFAFTADIDEWLARTAPNDAKAAPLELPLPPSNTDTVPISSTDTMRFGGIWLWLVLAAVAVLITVVLLWTRNPASSDVAAVSLSDGKLAAYDRNQHPLWTTPFERIVGDAPPTLVDLDANGHNEVVGFNGGRTRVPGEETTLEGAALVAFSGDGRRLWSYKPETLLQFGHQTYAGPWSGEVWATVKASSGPIFALAFHHYTWWPGLLITVDRSGKALGEFINSGWVTSLASFAQGSKPVLLAGGISNSNDAAMLAILDPTDPAGSSPEPPGSNYECRSCSAKKPLGYFVFPRSELNRKSISRYNQVIGIEPLTDRVLVHVREIDPTVFQTVSVIETIYEFSPEMQLKGFRLSDQYWDLHRHLEMEGKINHSQANCPDRKQPRIVRSWSPDSGWTEIPLPPL